MVGTRAWAEVYMPEVAGSSPVVPAIYLKHMAIPKIKKALHRGEPFEFLLWRTFHVWFA
jgi:hypothetical protein